MLVIIYLDDRISDHLQQNQDSKYHDFFTGKLVSLLKNVDFANQKAIIFHDPATVLWFCAKIALREIGGVRYASMVANHHLLIPGPARDFLIVEQMARQISEDPLVLLESCLYEKPSSQIPTKIEIEVETT